MIKNIFIIAVLIIISSACLFAGDEIVIPPADNYFFASGEPVVWAQADDLNSDLNAFDSDADKRKSSTKAILLSLAVPGLGEWYAGRKSRAVGFFLAEAGIWASYTLFKFKQSWLEDDYINFAIQHAGANPNDKSDHYFDMLGFYNSRDIYNKNSLVYSRENPFFPETPDWDWQWQSDELRNQYREIKNSSKAQNRNANFVLGVALANRVISAVDAWWSVKSYNRQYSPFFGKFEIQLSPSFSQLVRGENNLGVMLKFKHSF